MVKLLFLAPHPIPYQIPIFQQLSSSPSIEFHVLFCDTLNLQPHYNPEFSATIKYDHELLLGYKYTFFRNYAIRLLSGFFSRINPSLLTYLISCDYDAIIIHGYNTLPSWVAYLISVVRNKKVFFRGEGTLSLPLSPRRRIVRIFLKVMLSKAHAFFYSCSANRTLWQSIRTPRTLLLSMPCVVDNDYWIHQHDTLSPISSSLRSELSIPASALVITMCGRLTQRKNPLQLIEAVKSLPLSRIFLLFIGDGPLCSPIDQACSSIGVPFLITSHVQQDRLAKYLAVSDIFCNLSTFDASPKSLNEALCFSLPIIVSTNCGTAADLVQDGFNGFHVDPYQTQQISTALNHYLTYPKEVLMHGANSARIVDSFHPSSNTRAVLTALQS